MITDLIVTLKQAGLELNAEEIADILWLANQMQQAAPQPGHFGMFILGVYKQK